MKAVLPGVGETVDRSSPLVGYGFGPGYKGLVCTLILAKNGVKVGINQGARLDDPDGVLEGTGKLHRYIQLRVPADLRRPAVRRMLKAADQAGKARIGS